MQDNESMEAGREVQAQEEPQTQEPTAVEEDTLGRLARELSELRALVEARQTEREAPAAPPWQPTLTDEFRTLYPALAEGDIPDAVWDEVKKGVPLCAAYALAEHRAAKAARMSGHEAGTWHSLSGGTDEGLFSPAEVRAMTQYEVRRNYDRILESMKRW